MAVVLFGPSTCILWGWIPGAVQLWRKAGEDVLHQPRFIMDLNKSFQIGKIRMGERGCNFITFGLNVRLKLRWWDVSDFPGVCMLPYNSCNFNVGVQSFVICSKWGGNLIAGVYSVQEAGRYKCTKGGLQREAGGRRVIKSQEAFGSPSANVCGLLLAAVARGLLLARRVPAEDGVSAWNLV